jgi:hypothetical protein
MNNIQLAKLGDGKIKPDTSLMTDNSMDCSGDVRIAGKCRDTVISCQAHP